MIFLNIFVYLNICIGNLMVFIQNKNSFNIPGVKLDVPIYIEYATFISILDSIYLYLFSMCSNRHMYNNLDYLK